MRISDWSSDVCSSDLLSAPAPAGGVTLSYRTVDGSAKAGSDYTAVSGTLEIPAGEKVAFTPDIVLHGDDELAGDESFYLVLDNAVGANPVVTSLEGLPTERTRRMEGPRHPGRIGQGARPTALGDTGYTVGAR